MRNKLLLQYLKLKKLFQNGVSGLGVVEVILILVVIVGLVLIFKTQISSIMTSIFTDLKKDIKTL